MDADALRLDGVGGFTIPFSSLRSVERVRMNGVGTVLKVCHAQEVFFVSVVRFCLFGQFALINLYGTLALRDQLETAMRRAK